MLLHPIAFGAICAPTLDVMSAEPAYLASLGEFATLKMQSALGITKVLTLISTQMKTSGKVSTQVMTTKRDCA